MLRLYASDRLRWDATNPGALAVRRAPGKVQTRSLKVRDGTVMGSRWDGHRLELSGVLPKATLRCPSLIGRFSYAFLILLLLTTVAVASP
jgi:hypothetical protein